MRIMNKYNRNRHFRHKAWKRIRAQEQPYKTSMPFGFGGRIIPEWSVEGQVKRHFDEIKRKSRAIENGAHKGLFHATSEFRRVINKSKKAQVRRAMSKINHGDYDAVLPTFRKDADWLYF